MKVARRVLAAVRELPPAMRWGILGAVVLGISLVIFVGFRIIAAFGSPDEPLTAQVRIAVGQLQLTNSDPFEWTACKVTLNEGMEEDGWSRDIGRLPGGGTVSERLMAFTRPEGEAFNPRRQAVEDVLVDCETPEGRRTWTARFR